MTKPSIIITGANGYLGGCFVRHFIGLNWRVKAFVHHPPVEKIPEVEYVRYSLEIGGDEKEFDDVTAVLHGAYVRFDKDKNADAVNYEGMRRLIEICEKKAVPIVFLSSFSAHKNAVSHYGKSKMQCESLLDTTKHAILKIGFILGDGGLLRGMHQQMQQSRFFPLVGGQQPLQSIGMCDLYKVITTVVEQAHAGVFYVAHQEAWTMRAFYEELSSRLGQKLIFVPVPMGFLYGVCKLVEFLKITIPVSSESVLGLKKMTTFNTIPTQKILGFEFMDTVESLQALELWETVKS